MWKRQKQWPSTCRKREYNFPKIYVGCLGTIISVHKNYPIIVELWMKRSMKYKLRWASYTICDFAGKETTTRQWVVDLCKRGSYSAPGQDCKQDSPPQERAQDRGLLDVQRRVMIKTTDNAVRNVLTDTDPNYWVPLKVAQCDPSRG